MQARHRSIAAAGLVFVLAACGPTIRSGMRRAPDAQLGGGLTFVWDQESDRVYGDVRLEGNRFFEDRLHEAVEWELALRGIHRTDAATGDLRVHHHLSLTDHTWEEEIAEEGGYTRTELLTAEEGSVVVHVVDAATGKDIWVGWAEAAVDVAFTDPDSMRSWVYALVGEMFDGWPEAQRAAGGP